jgi:site-specific recombinase XerD
MTQLVKNDPLRLAKLENHAQLVNHESLWLANFTSKNTKKAYAKTFRDFCGYFAITDAKEFRGVHSADIVGYRDWLINQNYSNRTIRNKLAAISSCFKFLISKHVIDTNPVEGVQRPKVDESSGETPVMVAEQVKLLLKQPKN